MAYHTQIARGKKPLSGFDNWIARNIYKISRTLAIIFGIMWGIDGQFKFWPGLVSAFPSMVQSVAAGQPGWLQGWFSFWLSQANSNSAVLVYVTGVFELLLAFCLIAGFARKTAYGGGLILSLFIWAIPEGFGGPYGPGSTDIGTGIIYAMVFLFLIILNASNGTNPYSLDSFIEKKFKWWKVVAEVKR